MAKRKTPVLVDGENLVADHFSGVGHYSAELLLALDKLIAQEDDVRVGIWAHFRRIGRLHRFGFKNFTFRRFPFSTRISNGLKIKGLQPPIDLLYGRRIYLYTNYTSWPMLFSTSIPFIYDTAYKRYPQFVAEPHQRFLEEQVPKSIKRAGKVLTISKNSKKEIVRYLGVRAKDVFICHPAADTKHFYPRSSEEIERIKAKYAIFDDYIMFLSNLEPRKNLKGLLLAYEQLPAKIRKKYALLLVGAKGWNDDEIHEIILRLRLKGERIIQPVDYVVDQDRPALYSGASAFAYVSLYEGFGIPPLEAMACGTPVVSADNSSLPEAVGDAAVMVKADDPKSIASGIERLLTDKKLSGELVEKGYKQVDKFSYEESAKVLLDQMRGIV